MKKNNTQTSPFWTIHVWVIQNTTRLKNAGIESARLDCLLLLEHALGASREWLLANNEAAITKQNLEQLSEFVAQREKRIPLSYIIGSKEFYGRRFLVNKDVLIPRPESEVIIEMVLDAAKNNGINTVIDVGTGSGCLAITLKKELPNVHVTGIDISSSALKVARKNARSHNTQVQWREMDITKNGIPNMPSTRPYIVTANLPYVPDGMITSEEITKEPELALFSGNDGLNHYRALWGAIDKTPHKPIFVITESLLEQHESLQKMATESGYQLTATNTLVQAFSPKLKK